jgi:hypothetical protein
MTFVLVGTRRSFPWAWDEITYGLHILTTGGAERLEREALNESSATVSVVRIPVELFEVSAKIVEVMT